MTSMKDQQMTRAQAHRLAIQLNIHARTIKELAYQLKRIGLRVDVDDATAEWVVLDGRDNVLARV
jgi:hypothetical protein